ncbi:MAG: hypothetical protein V1791_04955 [Pseudomonadota bacterium]
MNIHIFGLAVFYGLMEISYFGWDMEPKSDAEMICNGINFLLFALAWLMPKGK